MEGVYSYLVLLAALGLVSWLCGRGAGHFVNWWRSRSNTTLTR